MSKSSIPTTYAIRVYRAPRKLLWRTEGRAGLTLGYVTPLLIDAARLVKWLGGSRATVRAPGLVPYSVSADGTVRLAGKIVKTLGAELISPATAATDPEAAPTPISDPAGAAGR